MIVKIFNIYYSLLTISMIENPKSKIVLLVEDDKALNRAVKFKLEQRGYIVISTMRGEDALIELKKDPRVDIVWLDLLLPGMNGMDFLAELRKNEETKDIKVVICSVSGEADSKERGKKLGISDYLVKSDYDIETLINKVTSYA